MLRLSLVNFIILALSANIAWSKDLVVGGQSVIRRDPVASSTVGIFSPTPGGRSGALCTGTLIKDGIALTAAHCIEPGVKPVLIFNRDLYAPDAVHRESQGVAVNPKWGRSGGRGMDQGDIALVKFDGRLPRGYRTVPTVASDAEIHSGARVTLAGYGISNAATKSGAGRLRKTEVEVLNSRPGKSEMILDQSHGHGACHGDSGGPAYIRRQGKISLAGLTNRSYPETAPDDCAHQVVYTKIPAYKSWIQKSERKLEAPAPLSARSERIHHGKTSVGRTRRKASSPHASSGRGLSTHSRRASIKHHPHISRRGK